MDNLKKSKDALIYHIKNKFCIAIDKLTYSELDLILNDINKIPISERTEEKWKEIVYKYIKPGGIVHLNEGLDTSDLNLLHQQIQASLMDK